MRKYIPIVLAITIVTMAFAIAVMKKNEIKYSLSKSVEYNIGAFSKQRNCAHLPQFLKRMHVKQPVMIDLTQKHYKGIALLHGRGMSKAIHPKIWEQYEHFATYALDKGGNVFLTPMPFISIKPTTFNLQKNIYRLDSKTGKIEIFMHFDDIEPTMNNPYGLTAIAYDCDDDTLWVSAIDKTDYANQRGRIYHLDIKSKSILETVESIDALTLLLLRSNNAKYLLAGSARDNGLYAYNLNKTKEINKPIQKFQKIIELTNSNEHIRKIKVIGKNHIKIQTIPFSYALIAQSAKKDRQVYHLYWQNDKKSWQLQLEK